jgi:hypothetical protein
MATPSLLQESPDFSLVRGGPFYDLLRRAHLSGSTLGRTSRPIIAAALITWLPLALLSLMQGAPAGAKLTFLGNIEIHVRLLIAIPVLIGAEVTVHQRMRITVKRFIERGIVGSHDVPTFNSAIKAAIRLRNSLPLEIGLLILCYTVGHWVWRTNVALETVTWYAAPEGSHLHLTLAGYWYAWISLPLFQFILLRWYLRFLNWFQFLWRVSRLDLHLLPAHPDRSGGLGFLGTGSYAFVPILFAQGTLLAGFLADRIFYQGRDLLSFKPTIALFVVFFLIVILAPLFVFTPHIMAAKCRGLGEYGTLAAGYVAEFEEKWLADGEQGSKSHAEELLGSGDIQSLADLGNSFGFVWEMRPVPFSLHDVISLAFATVAPVLPLLLTIMPLEELLSRVLKILF